MKNTADPDQLASDWSGSTLFAGYIGDQQDQG